ncbi:MAG: hypothetical protein V1845_03370 [bacterium]
MNKHLEPIFKALLPKLEETQIDYWVYGGISIAAFAGKFIRENKDVDIFVKDADFKKAKSILEELCNQNDFKLNCKFKGDDERPKIDIKIDGNKRFSVIPIYQKNNMVVFRYENKYGGDEEYTNQILERVERNISGYRFFTSPDEFIKEMFKNHIKARPDKKKRKEIKIDAKAIFTPEEYKKYMV